MPSAMSIAPLAWLSLECHRLPPPCHSAFASLNDRLTLSSWSFAYGAWESETGPQCVAWLAWNSEAHCLCLPRVALGSFNGSSYVALPWASHQAFC